MRFFLKVIRLVFHGPCPGKAGTVWGLGGGGIQGEVNKAGPSVWLSWVNCSVSMLVENADVSLVLEGYLWDSIFYASYTYHWLSRRRGDPACQVRVLSLNAGGGPCLPSYLREAVGARPALSCALSRVGSHPEGRG